MNNNYIRCIKTLSLFFLFVNPLTAAAVCESDTGTKVISKKHTHTTTYSKGGSKYIKFCALMKKTASNYIQKCAMWDSQAKKGSLNKSFGLFYFGKSQINNRPVCKPYGQLPRECVDHKVLEVFPVAQSSSKSHDGPACGVNWQYTACAYSPFKKGIMPKKERVERDPKKGISGKKRPEERAPRRRLERDR